MKNESLFKLLASYYSLYLKSQSYHWNVVGKNFFQFHEMFGKQYEVLAEEIDEIAERIRMLGEKVPASLGNFSEISIISSPNENLNDKEMLEDLYKSNQELIFFMKKIIKDYEGNRDVVTVDFITQKLSIREKNSWFLLSSIN